MSEPSLAEKADALEWRMIRELAGRVVKSVLFVSGEHDPTTFPDLTPGALAGVRLLMGDDPRLPPMPAKPTLPDFFRLRFASASHLLQSAALARKAGHGEKVILAALLHDIAVIGFIRGDHGYWGAQMIEPYVDEEVSWAVRAHQILRFYPDESVGYAYPEAYRRAFGADFRPEPYMDAAYRRMRDHKWYMTARLLTLNDVYAFDPEAVVDMAEFTDIIGRHFRQPEEGLGFDDSPSAHMWRTINRPTRFL